MNRALLTLIAPAPPTTLLAELTRNGIRVDVLEALVQPEHVPARSTALVWFVDDFPKMAMVQTISQLRAQRPGLRIVLFTAWPDELTALLHQMTGRVAPSVLRCQSTEADTLALLKSALVLAARH